MTRKERMFAAIRHQSVDHVPYATYNLHPYTENQHTADSSYAELLEKVKTQAGVAAKIGPRGAGEAMSRYREGVTETRIEGTGDDRIIKTIVHTPQGPLMAVRRAPENKPGMLIEPLVTSDQDIEKYMSLPYEPPKYDLSAIRAFCESAADRAVVFVGFSEPMYPTASLFGFEQFSVNCITDFNAIKRVVDWFFERCLENMKGLTRAVQGMDCVLHTGGPEICTPPMLSPDFFAELVTPYLKKLIDIIHDAGLLAGIHCHGHVREVFPHILETGADLLEPIEPPVQGNISLEELMDQAQGRICLMGYIQDQELYTARPGQMTERVRHIADVVNGRTGYIMSPTCTPFEHPCSDIYKRNYVEWLDAAEAILGEKRG